MESCSNGLASFRRGACPKALLGRAVASRLVARSAGAAVGSVGRCLRRTCVGTVGISLASKAAVVRTSELALDRLVVSTVATASCLSGAPVGS